MDRKGLLALTAIEKVNKDLVDRRPLPYNNWFDRTTNIYFWTKIYQIVEQKTPGRVDAYEPAPGDDRSFFKRTSQCEYQKK